MIEALQPTNASTSEQLSLFEEPKFVDRTPPTTRYQGSKLKLLSWIWEQIADFEFGTALDAFSGTASVSYLLKSKDKAVTTNDVLRFNHKIAEALIENRSVTLSSDSIRLLMQKHGTQAYSTFIEDTFHDIYFTDEENRWLDIVSQNIPLLTCRYEQALAYYCLFQACIAKRPYNLFHRRNLYMRTANVDRGFGNKATWDKPFDLHFQQFASIANAAVFDNGKPCSAMCSNALEVAGNYDLVYIDTPYLNKKGIGVDYQDFYHFLEGVVDYEKWPQRVDFKKKHRPLNSSPNDWSKPTTIYKGFQSLFERFADSILVISYRSDGIPSEQELHSLLTRYKKNVRAVHYGEYKYVLSTNTSSKELLLIGW